MRAVVVTVLLAALPGRAQALASSNPQWLLNPGAEHSQVLGTGALLGAGKFRVSLQTHLFLAPSASFTLREHVTAAWAPLERLELLAQVPIDLLQRPGAPSPEQGVGRPWAGARVGLFSPTRDDLGWLSVEAQVGIPGLEQAELATRTPLPTGLVKLAGGLPSGSDGVFGAELGGRFGANLVELQGGITFAGQGVHWGGELTVQGSLSVLGGARGFVELLGGVRYRLRPVELSLVAGPGYGLADQLSGRVVAGLSFVNPAEPEVDAPREQRADCTDGTEYRLEQCPELDWDHDGVLNGVDRCPREPGEKENQGCPWPDRDGDGTFDIFDNCPDEPGPANNAGCPPDKRQAVLLRKDRLELLEVVFFEFDKAVIKPESFGLLEQVAQVLRAHPELVRVRIEGHTDKVGSAAYNRELSLARARAVKTFLVERGEVAGERLSTRGYGFDKPIASNDDEAGRAKNRRVEFLILGGAAEPEPEVPGNE